MVSRFVGTKSGKSEAGDILEVDGKVTPSHSLPRDPVTVETHVAAGHGSHSTKKQRFGWGQGLAKYEKEKVKVQEDVRIKTDLQGADLKRIHSPSMGMPNTNQAVVTVSTRAFPGVASLVVSSPSPDVKSLDSPIDDDVCCDGPAQHQSNFVVEDSIRNLDTLDINAVNSFISKLKHRENSFSDCTSFPRSASISKLASLKKRITELLEKKEGEIDQTENEIRMLSAEMEGIVALEVGHNAGDGVAEHTRDDTNQFETSTGPTPLVASCQYGPFVPVAILSQQTVDSCEALDVRLVGSSNIDTDLMMVAPNEGAVNEPSGIDKEPGSKTPDRKAIKASVVGCSSKNVPLPLNLMLYVDDTLVASILASNKELAVESSSEVLKYLPVHANILQEHPTGTSDSVVHSVNTSTDVQTIFVKRNHHLRFKERFLALKYRTLHGMWKEGLPVRKHCTKQQRLPEPSCRRPFQNSSQKHHPYIRPQLTSSGKWVSRFPAKTSRCKLKMPSMVLVDERRCFSRFASWNGLIEDPCSVEKERTMINPWTTEEIEIFKEYFSLYGKRFSKIASHLEHKTTADCVEFYYKNHRSNVFSRIKESIKKSKKSKSVVPSTYHVGTNWNHVVLASHHVLKEDSVAAGHKNHPKPLKHMEDHTSERMSEVIMVGNDRDVRASVADLMAGIRGDQSSEVVSSCTVSSVHSIDGVNEWKHVKTDNVTPDTLQNIDEDACYDESTGEAVFSYWMDADKAIFITSLRSYEKYFATISRCVVSSSTDQCKIFFNKAQKCLGRIVIHMGLGNGGTPPNDDHGGHSDTTDACTVETESMFFVARNPCKMEVNNSTVGFDCSLVSTVNDGSGRLGSNSLQVEENVIAHCNENVDRLSQEIHGKSPLEVEEADVVDCDERVARSIQEILEDHLADTLVTMMCTEKVEDIEPAEDHVESSSIVDDSNLNHEDSSPGVQMEGSQSHLLDGQVNSETCERLTHVYDCISVESAQDSVDFDARSPGLSDHDKPKPQLVLRKCSSKQIMEGFSEGFSFGRLDSFAFKVGQSVKYGGVCIVRNDTHTKYCHDSGAIGLSSIGVDLVAQNLRAPSLQGVRGGSGGNSVCQNQRSHHGMTKERKLPDLMNDLTVQGNFLRESGNRYCGVQVEYSLSKICFPSWCQVNLFRRTCMNLLVVGNPSLGFQNQARIVDGVISSVNCMANCVVALKMQFAENCCNHNGAKPGKKILGKET